MAASRTPKKGFLQSVNPLNLFRKDEVGSGTGSSGTTGTDGEKKSNPAAGGSDTDSSSQPVPAYPRYSFHAPALATRGNRAEAERLFTQAVQAHQSRRLADAIQLYQRALQADGSYFEAEYNLGLASTSVGKLPTALQAYERALALQPDSADARYNFALALQQANYVPDAADQLEKLVARTPSEVRAHLALGNIFAQQLRQNLKARQHYQKVLDLDPQHPQAAAIRFWLAANPQS